MTALGSRSAPVAVAALATVVFLAACSADPAASPATSPSPTPAATRPAGPDSSASASVEPSPSGVLDLAWERIRLPAVTEGSAVVDVEAAGPGFVALGFDGTTGSVVWTSSDGHEWAATTPPEWKGVGLSSMVEVDGRLVAVGRSMADIETDLATVWISDDGVEWRQAAGGPDLEGAQLIKVVATDDGFVAIGGYPRRDAAAAFTSPDGEVWTRATKTDRFEQAFMWAVAEAGPGLVAVGWRRNPDAAVAFDPAFWTSVDGSEWTMAPTPEGAPGAQGRDAIGLNGSVVAVGDLVNGGASSAWTSPDGDAWELVEAPDSFDGALIADLSPIPGGIVAVGGRGGDGRMWVSSDGREWQVVDDAAFADAYLTETLAVADGLLVVGATQQRITGSESFTTTAVIWYGAREP